MKKIGLIINPIAGMGGRVGLKGTDGPEILARARARGARPQAPKRAEMALRPLLPLQKEFKFLTCQGSMGAEILAAADWEYEVIDLELSGEETEARDTINAARIMKEEGVELLIFAGGDGTARDIFKALDNSLPVIGIPAGVKIHSGVFANTPLDAGQLALNYLRGDIEELIAAEVMDIDEEAFREGRVSAKLYGFLHVPADNRLIQGLKTGAPAEGEKAALDGIAQRIIDDMDRDNYYFVGPGTTTRLIMEKLGLEYSLLGVDVVQNKELKGKDVGEQELLDFQKSGPSKIVVTPIGGQGFVFGRGNQQFSPDVLRRVKKKDIIIIGSKNKLTALEDGQLKIDSGDQEIDQDFSGYYRIRIGYQEERVFYVRAAAVE